MLVSNNKLNIAMLKRVVKEFILGGLPLWVLLFRQITIFYQPLTGHWCGVIISPHSPCCTGLECCCSHTFGVTCPVCFFLPGDSMWLRRICTLCNRLIHPWDIFLILIIAMKLLSIVPAIQSCAACHPS